MRQIITVITKSILMNDNGKVVLLTILQKLYSLQKAALLAQTARDRLLLKQMDGEIDL